MMGCPSLPALGELLALNACFASSLLGKDIVSQELVLVTCDSWDSRELLAAGGCGAPHPTLPLLSRSRKRHSRVWIWFSQACLSKAID